MSFINFRGDTYRFVGNPNIKCECLSNGGLCNQENMKPLDRQYFIGKHDAEGKICTKMWVKVQGCEVNEEPVHVITVKPVTEKTIDELIEDCYYICGTVPFLEYYSHDDAVCWKILNKHTKFKEHKTVLCKQSEGIRLALERAIPYLAKCESEYLSENGYAPRG